MHESRRRARAGVFLLTLLWGSTRALAQEPQDVLAAIASLNCDLRGKSVRVSYVVQGALDTDTRSSLESGLTVKIVHDLSLVRRRGFVFRRTLGHRTVEVTASLDTLTKQYALTRQVEGQPVQTQSTDSLAEVDRWLTEVHESLDAPSEIPAGGLDVKVETVSYRRRMIFNIIPWPVSARDTAECR
jgi:hypothetical protein